MKYLILDYLEATAARLPQKVTFTDECGAIAFGDLVRLSRAVGSALCKHVAPRTTVGFYMDKSVQTVAGFFGAVYAGCAYSQLNLRHPAVRIKAILDTLASPVVVTDRAHEQALREMDVPGEILILEDLLESEIDESALARVRRQMLDIDPLYVNFTSGSTGTPKGVIICHRNVCDFIPCFTEIFEITEDDVLANQAPFDFDVSVKDIYSGIFTGATVAIVPTAYFTQPMKLMDFICEQKATVLVWAVSALCFITTMNALDYKTPDTLRTIMFSGEVMPIKHLKKLQKYLPEVTYVNLYGPTEITCNCTYYIVDREFEVGENLPIGISFPNERILLLDENDREVAPGGVGELCVSGTAVALGYFGDSERTKAAFVQNPLNKTHNEIIYRTGDLVRLTEEGELVYVSRKDFQIKHMGHRIELGEIEVVANMLPGVSSACCLFDNEKKKIILFYAGQPEVSEMAAYIKEKLPRYMVPNVIRALEAMPFTPNGKIDRNLLKSMYEK